MVSARGLALLWLHFAAVVGLRRMSNQQHWQQQGQRTAGESAKLSSRVQLQPLFSSPESSSPGFSSEPQPLQEVGRAENLHAADINVDVCVIGGGIAGTTISWLLQEREKLQVALIDPKVNKPGSWYPNYGEWRDEWEALSERLALPELRGCTTTEWEKTDCFFGGSFEVPMAARTTLARPYVRVDRIKMQALLRGRFDAAQGLAVEGKLSARQLGSENIFDGGLVHDSTGSTLQLDDGRVVRCSILIDASGLESRLVAKEKPFYARGSTQELPTGFQIAYGFIAHTDKLGPYDKAAMTLFDYRTDHLDGDEKRLQEACDKPTVIDLMSSSLFSIHNPPPFPPPPPRAYFFPLPQLCSSCTPCPCSSTPMARTASFSRRRLWWVVGLAG